MAVRIRLKRVGRRHRAAYRIAIVDKRRSQASRVIEEVGSFDPLGSNEEQSLKIDRDRVEYWLSVGAQPTDTVRRMLQKRGFSRVGSPS